MDMHNYRLNWQCLSVLSLALIVCSCTARVETPKDYKTESLPPPDIQQGNIIALKTSDTNINLEEEAQIEKECLAAWRKCVAGNTKEGIADLKKLGQEYPHSSSVLFMTGQAMEKFGNKKEALVYYEKAANDSDFAIMSLFKIAEALRASGKTEQAIIRYRKLISIAPEFAQAHLGLAKALNTSQPHSSEAQKELKKVLQLDPNNKEAQDLLKS